MLRVWQVNVAAPRLCGRSSSGYSDSIDAENASRAAGIYVPQRKSASEIKAELDDMEMKYALKTPSVRF